MNRLAIILVAGASALAMASAAHAADLIIEDPYIPPVVDVGGDWEGAFIGVFAGYGFGDVDDTLPVGGIFTDDSLDLSGWLVGVDLGYNFYLSDGVVLGIVGDIAWSDVGGDDDGTDVSYNIDWSGSLRGRIGFDGGAFMPYLTGGLAVAGATLSDDVGDEIDSATHFGWTVGAGVEIAATEDLSIDLLYRYSDYGEQEYDGADLSLTEHRVTAGLHWNF